MDPEVERQLQAKALAGAGNSEAEIDAECERIMAMSDAEIEAHVRAQGLDPAEEARRMDAIIRNARVQVRYDELMRAGKHGHYETLFQVVREEVERATSTSK